MNFFSGNIEDNINNINPYHFNDFINYPLGNNNPFNHNSLNNINNNSSNNIYFIQNPFITDKKLVNLQESINFNLKNNEDIEEEEDKAILFFKSHNFTNDNEIIKRDEKINEIKKFYDNLSNDLEDEMKCCICLNRYNDPLLCPYCHHFFCRKCILKWFDENKNNCVYCRKEMDIQSFIEISAFRKILPFLELLKENNNDYFSNKLKNNINKVIIKCSNKIHEKIEEKGEKGEKDEKGNKDNSKKDEINEIKDIENKDIDNFNDIKADYYCFNCKKPFCSDCICLNDDYIDCEHNNDHFVFNIELLNDMKLFDLLYEKENNKTTEILEKMNEEIKEEINILNKKKSNILLFIEYIKNTYIELIEININKLKEIFKENEEEINNIKNKFDEINTFINNLKSDENIRDIKNVGEIDNYLRIFNNIHKFPEKTKNTINDILKFSGNFQIVEHINKIIEFDENNFDTLTYNLNLNLSLILINENFINNNNMNNINITNISNPFLVSFDSIDNEQQLKKDNNKTKKIKMIIKLDNFSNNIYYNNLNKNKEIEKYKTFFPILFNNENEYIIFKEIKENDDLFLIKENQKNLFKNNNIFLIDKKQNDIRYFRKYVDIDKLKINDNDNDNDNDIKYNNKDNKKISNKYKIKLCLHSLIIS